MKLIKIVPKSQGAANRIKEHGEYMEILLDEQNSFMVRSLEATFKYREGVFGKWIGTFTTEEAVWEEKK